MSSRPVTHRMDEAAQVGIGTMIVFIATVLVSAVAAGVLLDMSGKLQQKSSKTGSDATEEISSNIFVESIIGNRTGPTEAALDELAIYVSLAPGAKEIDLMTMTIQVANGTKLVDFNYTKTLLDADSFNATDIRDADDSFSSTNPSMSSGDLVKIRVDLAAASMAFETREDVKLTLIPETGTKVSTGFSTPASWGTKTVIHLV